MNFTSGMQFNTRQIADMIYIDGFIIAEDFPVFITLTPIEFLWDEIKHCEEIVLKGNVIGKHEDVDLEAGVDAIEDYLCEYNHWKKGQVVEL